MDDLFVIIPAGGSGTRFGGAQKKQFTTLSPGETVLAKTVSIFLAMSNVKRVVVCLPVEELDEAILPQDRRVIRVAGGETRSISVYHGFVALQPPAEAIILVHDGVRPNVTMALIKAVSIAAKKVGAAIPVLPVTDTIKQIGKDAQVLTTPERSQLRAVQTPQGFRADILEKAYAKINFRQATFTDEAMLVEQAGQTVMTVPGDPANIKMTTVADRDKLKPLPFRVGVGYDVHRLVEGRPCKIGGIIFDHNKGLLGHSDADVLLHAICDALLGAANLGDLGSLFPDTDERYKGADSRVLLKECYGRVKAKGYRLGNLDTVVVCEKPKLKPRREEIQAVLAELLESNLDSVSVKATTEEKLGFTGREEGIAAWAYVTIIAESV